MAFLHSAIVTTLNLLLMFSVLVVVHEWGHFIVARIFKIRVDEFSLGFGPRMFRIGRRGDTEYNVRWALLGGYVKIAGMEPDDQPLTDVKEKAKALLSASDPNRSEIPLVAENTKDRAEDEEQRRRDAIDGFYSKPGWQRALVIFAGPLMSFVLGVVLLCSAGFLFGVPDHPTNVVDSVSQKSAAETMGLRAGDKIVKINSIAISNGEMMVQTIHSSLNKQVVLTVMRGNQSMILAGTPQIAKDPSTGKCAKSMANPSEYSGSHRRFHYQRVGVRSSIKNGFEITSALMTLIAEKFQHVSGIAQSTGGGDRNGVIHESGGTARTDRRA